MDNYAYQPDENNGRPFAITRYSPRSAHNNSLVEVNSRSKFFKKTSSYKIIALILVVVTILLLVGLITLITLYVNYESLRICTTNECLRTAASLKYSIDFSVDPCQNFYKFACGKWSEEHPNHGWFRTFSSFTTISERVAIASQNALTDELKNSSNDPQAIKKAKDFFKSCLDTDALNDLGVTSMYKYIKGAKLPIIPSYFTISEEKKASFTFDWMESETLIKQIFMKDVFIGVVVESNVFNGTENVIYIGKIFQVTPLPSPVKSKKIWRAPKHIAVKADEGDDEDDAEEEAVKTLERQINSNIIKYVFKEVMANMSMEIPEDNTLQEAADIILDIADFVEQLTSNVTDDGESFASADDIYSISFKTLQSRTDEILSSPEPNLWSTYFKNFFTGTNVTFDPENDRLFVTDQDIAFIDGIIPYVVGSPPLHIELYMWWNAVFAMIINTSNRVADFIDKQLDVLHTKTNFVARSRSLECALRVNNYMGYAVSYAIADQSFPNTTKPKVERMINELKQTFVNHVKTIDWMDEATKKVTIEKSQEMISFIGYPNWLFQPGKLDEFYADVEINETRYLDNMISVIISQNLKKINSLREKHERDWYSEPIEVNAFNSYSENAINVPMAILTFPIYNLGLEVLNYGSIGAILGHELTHGFDNMGRKHDKFGNHVQWWSNKTIETFEKLTECFIHQYENITIEGVAERVKGKATLGENLADNGGLNQAFQAYKNHISKYGHELHLPGFENYTNYQMFFIAYGNMWCQTISPEDIRDQIKYDEHCPNSVRVMGSLQNSEDFSEVFHCPKGSKMNPAKKCKIW